MTAQTTPWDADPNGWFGDASGQQWGGRYMPEALVAALDELTVAWQEAMADEMFLADFDAILRDYANVP
ncbi:MAG: tryptophan synthase subunit beta, partial [Candidatus Limnocylindrales bacterium]